MARSLGLFVLLWVVSASGLAVQSVWAMTPPQRAYLRPAIEAELLAPFSFHVPFTAIGFDPLVTAIFVPAPRIPARWMSVPATQTRRALATVYPERLLPTFARIAVIATAEASILYLVLLVAARYIARRPRVGNTIPVAPAAPPTPGAWGR